MQRYAGLGSERYCWREGSVIDDLRYVHGFGIERNSSVRGVQIQSIRQRSRALTFRFSWGGEFGGGPASAGPPPKFPGPSVVMFPTFYGHSCTLSGQTHLFVSQNRVGDGRLRAQSRPKPASQKYRQGHGTKQVLSSETDAADGQRAAKQKTHSGDLQRRRYPIQG